MVSFRLVTNDNIPKTLGQMIFLNKTNESLEFYIEYLWDLLNKKQDGYNNVELRKVVFSFGIRKGLAKENQIEIKERDLNTTNYYKYLIPITLNPLEFGTPLTDLVTTDKGSEFIVTTHNNNFFEIHPTVVDGKIINNILFTPKGNSRKTQIKIVDKQINDNYFIRTIDDPNRLVSKERIYVCNMLTNQEELNFEQKPTRFLY